MLGDDGDVLGGLRLKLHPLAHGQLHQIKSGPPSRAAASGGAHRRPTRRAAEPATADDHCSPPPAPMRWRARSSCTNENIFVRGHRDHWCPGLCRPYSEELLYRMDKQSPSCVLLLKPTVHESKCIMLGTIISCRIFHFRLEHKSR